MNYLLQPIRLLSVITLTLGLATQPSLADKGGGGKVTVTAAEPAQADQGQELDVYISGDGFDEGSTATFYVTGTNDDTQIVVESTTFEPSTGRLKSHINVSGTALVTDYDVEVRTAGGRRGKGTTLFKVQSVETACTGLESKEPEIAYLTALTTDGDFETQDLYLSSASGCDQYLLLEDAVVKVPDSNFETGAYLVGVRGLRLDVHGDKGVVIWRDEEGEIDKLYALRFDIALSGAVTADASGPVVAYATPSGAEVQLADVRFNDDFELELLVLEGYRSGGQLVERRLVYANVSTMDSADLMAGSCPVQDAASVCYIPDAWNPWWNEDGSQVFVNLVSANYDTGIGRLSRVAGVWQPAQVLMTHESQVFIIGIRSDGLLAYGWSHFVSRRNGRTNFKETETFTGSIDPELCDSVECTPNDGELMPVDSSKFPRGWTRDWGLLFMDNGPGAQLNIRVYSDPFSGTVGTLEITDVDRAQHDTTY